MLTQGAYWFVLQVIKMSKYFSSKLSSIEPYVPGEQPRDKKYIKLNTNESPFPPSPEVIKALNEEQVSSLNLYSDPTAKELVDAIAEYYSVDAQNIFVGNGSDEVLAFAFYAWGENGFTGPELSYGFYPVFSQFFSIDYTQIALKEDLSIELADYFNVKNSIIFANPNAQTGLYITPDKIEELVSKVNCVVVVDEAYIDFGGESVIPLTKKYPNLVVTGTLSKSRNLAGARIGFAIGNKELINDLNTLKFSFNPYNLNRLSIIAGAKAFKDKEYFEKCVSAVAETREYTKKALVDLGFSCTNSLSNFILAKTDKMGGKDLYLALKEKGILVRYLGDEIIKDYVRITIGSKEQMMCLVETIKSIL